MRILEQLAARALNHHSEHALSMQPEAKARLISDAQLETVAYAVQRFYGERLEDGSRAGFFLGDGAGVGKGRQISAVVKEMHRRGTRRILWLSHNNDLREDARRDMTDMCVLARRVSCTGYLLACSRAVWRRAARRSASFVEPVCAALQGHQRAKRAQEQGEEACHRRVAASQHGRAGRRVCAARRKGAAPRRRRLCHLRLPPRRHRRRR